MLCLEIGTFSQFSNPFLPSIYTFVSHRFLCHCDFVFHCHLKLLQINCCCSRSLNLVSLSSKCMTDNSVNCNSIIPSNQYQPLFSGQKSPLAQLLPLLHQNLQSWQLSTCIYVLIYSRVLHLSPTCRSCPPPPCPPCQTPPLPQGLACCSGAAWGQDHISRGDTSIALSTAWR